MSPAPSVKIGPNHARDSTQMRVNLFTDARKISQTLARELRSTTARKLPQRPADDSELLVRRRQQMHLLFTQLRLPRQVRANQRHDPPVAVKTRRCRALVHHIALCDGQADLDTTARLPDHRPYECGSN
jgi:hypothetical protein